MLFCVPAAVFLSRNAVLSSFALGRQTSLVVDCGHGSTIGKDSTGEARIVLLLVISVMC